MAATNSYIQRLLDYISGNNQAINRCNNSRNAALRRKSEYQRRLQQLDAIRRDLTGGFNGHTDGITGNQREFNRKLEGAVGKASHTQEIEYNVTKDLEPQLTAGSEGYQMLGYIDRERNRCQQEIQNAQTEADGYAQQISSMQGSNREANRRIANERRRLAQEQQG